MNKKAILVVVLASMLTLVLALPVGAYYSNAVGELRDSVTNSPWVHGATIRVTNCSSANNLVAPVTVGASGTFNISLAGVNSPNLCFEIDFFAAANGEPVTQIIGRANTQPPAYQGTLDLGIIYTSTGPSAVSLQQVSASAAGGSPVWLVAGVMLLGALSLVAIRRSRV